MKDKWSDDLRRQLEGYESPEIPEGLWAGIENGIDAGKPKTTPIYKKTAYMVAAVAAIIAIICGVKILVADNEEITPESVIAKAEQTNVAENKSEEEIVYETPEEKIVAEKSAGNVSKANVSASTRNSSADLEPDMPRKDASKEEIFEEDNEETENIIEKKETTEREKPTEQNKETKQEKKEEQKESIKTEDEQKTPVPVIKIDPNISKTIRDAKKYVAKIQKDDTKSVSFAMYFASGYSMANDNNPEYNSSESTADPGAPENPQDGGGEVEIFGERYPPDTNDSTSHSTRGTIHKKFSTANAKTSETHDRPISIGLQIGIPLSERLKLHTGLEYTTVKSEWEKIQTSSSKINQIQRFHFIGIPVQISYNLVKTNHWNVYLGAGGKIDFGISGTLKTIQSQQNANDISTNKSISDVPTVFQFNAMPGIQYRFIQGLNIYAEPSVAYSIQSSEKFSTYYTEHPWMFDLRFGLRWNLGK